VTFGDLDEQIGPLTANLIRQPRHERIVHNALGHVRPLADIMYTLAHKPIGFGPLSVLFDLLCRHRTLNFVGKCIQVVG